MYMRVSAEIQTSVDLSATDVAALVMAAVLVTNVVWRLRRNHLNSAGLLRANMAMAVVVILSISSVFAFIDPLIGGDSLLNCLSHFFMIYAGWQVTIAMAQFLQPFDGLKRQPLLIRAWVPVVAAIGTLSSFLILNPGSSRGLDAYDHRPAFVMYWASTLLPLILGAFHLLPRMVKLAPMVLGAKKLTAISMSLLWLSLVGVLLSTIFYGLSAINESLWVAREIVVTLTTLAFAVGFLLATAALPRATGRTIRRQRQEEIQAAPQ